ncbi:hypothetical protein O181_098005 [Austropuccinia psidii MF-1]|uniref:Uncharacterized protein n=1 Tax=Austropuccinia psidii MF-1 TaxID=1389203 RepID=A0A9Q3PEH0_9BASI|nr:hypothetical protein [Austropuccinia psidii MF-1]
MDWVTGLVPGGKENYNAYLIIVDSFSKSMRCLPFHEKDTAISHLKYRVRGLTPSNGYAKCSSKSGIFNGTRQTELAPILLKLWSNSDQIRLNKTFTSHLTSTVLV